MREMILNHVQRFVTVLLLGAAALCGALCSCCDESDVSSTYTFIGDSLVKRWDLQQNFPMLIVKNLGLSSSGIEYLEDKKGAAHGTIVVVLSGTNNLREFNPTLSDYTEKIETYTQRFIAAVSALDGRQAYIISVLPRDNKQQNEIIKDLNESIKLHVEDIKSITFVDVFEYFLYEGRINPEYTYDGLHLSAQGYEVLTYHLNRYMLN